MILCPRITLGIYQTFNWAWLAMGWNISRLRWTGQHKGWLKVDRDEPLHLKTFIYISISSYNQLGTIQHHITVAYAVDTISQCIHNASTKHTQGFHNAYTRLPQCIHKASTMHTQGFHYAYTTSVEIQNNRIRIRNDITCAIL